jgi:uncharacterized protein
MEKNVFGEKLLSCGTTPMTGFYRNGCCENREDDIGVHAVCAVVTDEFLHFSKSAGNDLSTPRPEFMFAGLKHGDHWCLCAARWVEAMQAGMAPKVVLEATNERTLDFVPLEVLVKYAYKNSNKV